MFTRIKNEIKYPMWADTRWRNLYALDLWLDGKFYDHLNYDFYTEALGNDEYIEIAKRRPSVQFNIPKHIATSISRKLFAGRHVPRFIHSQGMDDDADADDPMVDTVNAIAAQVRLWTVMQEAAIWGSVGAVAITFKVRALDNKQGQGRLIFELWKARDCFPRFDIFGELSILRVARLHKGAEFKKLGYPPPYNQELDRVKEYESNLNYWFVRDFTTADELTYIPVEEAGWNPCGTMDCPPDSEALHKWEDRCVSHQLGFVPGHWIRNLSGGHFPEGDCTWECALNTCIEADYTMSQLGRGIRYTAAPQLAIEGELVNWDFGKGVIRGPAHILQFKAAERDVAGGSTGGGKAYLLETKGEGLRAGLSYFEQTRKIALEQISMSRKDPDKFRVPQSGKAMEILDEDFNDLLQEARTNYGDEGLIPLTRKALIAAKKSKLYKDLDEDEINELQAQWPKIYQVSSGDLQSFAQAMQILIEPDKDSQPVQSQPSANGNGNGARPAAAPKAQPGIGLIDKPHARALLDTLIDIPPRKQKRLPTPLAVKTDTLEDVPTSDAGAGGGDTPSGDEARAAVAAPTQPQLLNGQSS